MEPGGRPDRPWRALGAGAGVLGGEGLAMALHPALGEAMAAADVIVPLAIAVVLIASWPWSSCAPAAGRCPMRCWPTSPRHTTRTSTSSASSTSTSKPSSPSSMRPAAGRFAPAHPDHPVPAHLGRHARAGRAPSRRAGAPRSPSGGAAGWARSSVWPPASRGGVIAALSHRPGRDLPSAECPWPPGLPGHRLPGALRGPRSAPARPAARRVRLAARRAAPVPA